jgi:hypothetical protein
MDNLIVLIDRPALLNRNAAQQKCRKTPNRNAEKRPTKLAKSV